MLRKHMLLAMSVLLPSLTSAQSSASSASASSSTGTSSSSSAAASVTPKVHRVNVGIGGFSYDPNVTIADVGDIVQFVFYPTNHSVIRAEYAGSDVCGPGGCNPCVPYEIMHSGEGGFHSGNMDVGTYPSANSISSTTKTFNITVDTADPIWYYCNALTSCHPHGMVGVINPNEAQLLSKQQEAAIAAPFQLAPDQAWPAEGSTPGAETASASGFSSPTTTANSTSSTVHHSTLSGGAIAGIVIAGVAVLGLAAALFYFIGRSKTYKDMFTGKHSETAGTASQVGDGLGPWNPAPAVGAVNNTAYPDHRMSHMTQYSQAPSQVPSDGTFVGYNRHTGAPEFAAEAPISEHGTYQHVSPQVNQGGFQQNKRETFELPASTPEPPKTHEKP